MNTTTYGVDYTIDITAYSGITGNMTYDSVNNYIYVSNVSNSNVNGIITIDCDTNTVISFTSPLSTTSEVSPIHYDFPSSKLWYGYGNTGSTSFDIFCT
jgi:hypothetical protein